MSGTEDFQAFVREAFTGLTGKLTSMADTVSARFDRMEKRQDSLEAELIKTRTEIMARIDRTQATLDSVREDVGVKKWA